MASPTEITVAQLARRIGLPDAPAIVDVRTEEEFRADPRLLPCAQQRACGDVASWAGHYAGRSIVVICQRGNSKSQTAASWCRQESVEAQTLEGGLDAWLREGQPTIRAQRVPRRDGEGRTVWVTRGRPKVVRIACPWLVCRFIDPDAAILFVPPGEVAGVASQANATPFDVEGTFWSDRGVQTTFDVMLEEFGLGTEPLLRLARIIRGADTGRLDLAPQASGLLAACLGFSRMYREDQAQLAAATALFDAYYRWARDAFEERHG
jgi:rhodanese-related sulfurtransferase